MRHWYRRGAARLAAVAGEPRCSLRRGAAAPASLPRSGFCRSAHPGIPVIVVGNITVGGSGKTPLVHLDRRIPQGERLDARRSSRAATARSVRRAAGRDDRLDAATRSATSRSCSRGAAAARCGSAPTASQVVAALRARASGSRRADAATTACSTTACGATSRSRWSTRAASATACCCPPGRCASRRGGLRSVDAVVSHRRPTNGQRDYRDAAGRRRRCTA